MTRKRNPRSVLREQLNHLYKSSKALRDYWTVPSRVYERGQGFRPRTADEYPENDAANWDAAAEYAEAMAEQWATVAEDARLQARRVRDLGHAA